MTFRSMRPLFSSGIFAVAVCCTGCAMMQAQKSKNAQPPPLPPVVEAIPAAPVSAQPTAAQLALDQGVALYNDGDYNYALKKLAGISQSSGVDKLVQLKALKYMAFSYCVMGRQAQCRQEFDKALKLDPSFDLDQGEKGHPLWGPVFEKAKKADTVLLDSVMPLSGPMFEKPKKEGSAGK
jgi:tetratricopeptide (TPR) repeat protein